MSDLRKTISDAVDKGFEALGNIVVSATYKKYIAGASDGAGGFLDPTWTETSIDGIIGRYNTQEIFISGGTIAPNDNRFLVLAKSLTGDPSTDDMITVNSKSYNILGSSIDPAGAMYTIHLREQV